MTTEIPVIDVTDPIIPARVDIHGGLLREKPEDGVTTLQSAKYESKQSHTIYKNNDVSFQAFFFAELTNSGESPHQVWS